MLSQEFVIWGSEMNPIERPTADDLWSHKFLECACTQSHMKKKLKQIFLIDNINEALS
jgi:hypothetical protein